MCQEYASRGYQVRILSFEKSDLVGYEIEENISVIVAPPGTLICHMLWMTHLEHFQWADVIRTNQSYMAWVYALATARADRPLLLRCGYVRGEYFDSIGMSSFKIRVYKILEGWAFRRAAHIIVTTAKLKDWLTSVYRVEKQSISVVPNYVDTSKFLRRSTRQYGKRLISVGRLHKVKRFDMVLRACALIPGISITIIGDGPEREGLVNLAAQLNVKAQFPGIVPNTRLPDVLNDSDVFVMASMREGHPKALIEAMACALPCVAVKCVGLEDFIAADSVIVSDPSPDSLCAAIYKALSADAGNSYGRRGEQFVRERYSLGNVLSSEIACVDNILAS